MLFLLGVVAIAIIIFVYIFYEYFLFRIVLRCAVRLQSVNVRAFFWVKFLLLKTHAWNVIQLKIALHSHALQINFQLLFRISLALFNTFERRLCEYFVLHWHFKGVRNCLCFFYNFKTASLIHHLPSKHRWLTFSPWIGEHYKEETVYAPWILISMCCELRCCVVFTIDFLFLLFI